MDDFSLSGSDEIMRALEKIAAEMGGGEVSAGFMEGSNYPDGTPVAAVAFWNEMGDPANNRPARPFFRQMIEKESPTWVSKFSNAAQATGLNAKQALGMMGEDIRGALEQSITDFTSPGLAQSTIDAKGFEKPLIDTGHMKNSISYEVKT